MTYITMSHTIINVLIGAMLSGEMNMYRWIDIRIQAHLGLLVSHTLSTFRPHLLRTQFGDTLTQLVSNHPSIHNTNSQLSCLMADVQSHSEPCQHLCVHYSYSNWQCITLVIHLYWSIFSTVFDIMIVKKATNWL